jgi:hypothetical protein
MSSAGRAAARGRGGRPCCSHNPHGARSEHDCLRFFLAADGQCPLNKQRAGVTQLGGEPAAATGQPVGRFRVTGVAVRFYGPKQRHTLAVHQHGYTDWITVDAITDPAVCFASLLYWYVRATEALHVPAGI